ncbi:hypothetical protein KORDIASMS9_02900 [Kordia sp. SMS9]|uniref:hypothetical protein n=1 Tax=Kordia sp. SMS9 TaxID=2282170 RepID=UPI000E0D9521|nr:hypothetical protein [Kordia sp. SMS9]AXG70657.1 hypothetical protein KORDIASMS9_02900 [Kordia sp. SMS9]
MKKQILSIGKVLSKKEQSAINGGIVLPTPIDFPCEEPVLPAPPIGCNYVKIGPCRYKLVCFQATPY